MKNNKLLYIVDSIIVLLNLAGARGCYLLFLLLGLSTQLSVTYLVILIDFIYIPIRFGFVTLSIPKKRFLLPILFFIFVPVINLFNMLMAGKSLGAHLAFFILQVCFVFILLGLTKDYLRYNFKKSSLLVSRGYVWLTLISVIGVIATFALTILFGPQKIPVHADYLEANSDRAFFFYYWSYFSMVLETIDLRLIFFQSYGYMMGLFHEPHVFAYNVFPALFILLGFAQGWKSNLVIFIIFLSFLFSASITSLFALLLCLYLYFLINMRVNVWKTVIGIGLMVVVVNVFLFLFGDVFLDFLYDHIAEDSGSRKYSESTLLFAFSPRTLLGSNILSPGEYIDDLRLNGVWTSDVGYACFFLNIGFLFSYILNVRRLVLMDEKIAKAVGFASLYYMLHSAKIGIMVFITMIPILLVFLQYLTLVTYGRRKIVTSNKKV